MCTTFMYVGDDNTVVGKNLDMFTDLGYIFTNQKGIKKTALIMPPEQAAAWVAVYGSITFNQAGKEFPGGGINEKGLVVEQMTLPETKYCAGDSRPGINELQWIQYILDTSKSIEEAVKQAVTIRISENSVSRLHYLLADPSGRAAVIEYIEGEMLVYQDENLPLSVLTNCDYSSSIQYCHGRNVIAPNNQYQTNSYQRFQTAVNLLQDNTMMDKHIIEKGFEILDKVKRNDTAWSIVYELKTGTVYFKTARFPGIKIIRIKDLDFSREDSHYLKMNLRGEGDIISAFNKYNTEVNKELIYSFYRNEIFVKALNASFDDQMLDFLAAYPEKMTKI